jgi:hypothetical protein
MVPVIILYPAQKVVLGSRKGVNKLAIKGVVSPKAKGNLLHRKPVLHGKVKCSRWVNKTIGPHAKLDICPRGEMAQDEEARDGPMFFSWRWASLIFVGTIY